MAISPEEWERIAGIFEKAVRLPAEERSGFIAGECHDPEMERVVHRLIAEDQEAGDFLDRPLAHVGDALGLPAENRIGTTIRSRYRIVEQIARGGAGLVYLAIDLGRESSKVVIKLLHEEGRDSAWLRRKFRGESEALGRLDHPNIVRVLDSGETEQGERFLVMEHVPGVTLRTELQKGPMALARVANIVRQAGSAVGFAHRCGIVHRDLKPENLMLTLPVESTTVKVIDFGIAQVRGGHTETETGVRLIAGTTRYMAPEQLLGEPSEASDVFALGVIAYEMIAGAPPFPSDGAVDMLKQQGAGQIRDLRDLRRDVSDHAWRLIRKALSFRADDRPAGAEAFTEALAAALGHSRGMSRLTRRAAILAGIGAAAASPFAYRLWEDARAPRVIDNFGAFASQFDRHEMPILNPAGTQWEAWRESTSNIGQCFVKLSDAQKRLAVRNGWRLTVTLRVLSGSALSSVDLFPLGRSYDINVCLGPDDQPYVLLVTQLEPVSGPAVFVGGSRDAYHEYDLAFDPHRNRVSLSIDGTTRLTNYEGRPAAQGELIFGVSVFRAAPGAGRGVADFKKLRFAIGPN